MKCWLILACLPVLVQAQIRINSDFVQTPPQKALPQLYFAPKGYKDSIDRTLVVSKENLADELPSTFQYRVNCGDPTRTPWVSDQDVAKRVSYTTCSDLLKALSIRVIKKYDPIKTETIDVPLIPVPATQVWNDKTVTTDLTGISRVAVSDCCNAAACPDRCLQKEGGQRCFLEIYIVDWTYEYSSESDAALFFTGQPAYSRTGASLQLVFRIPCLFCQVQSCNMICNNGEVQALCPVNNFLPDNPVFAVCLRLSRHPRGTAPPSVHLLYLADTSPCQGLNFRRITCHPCTPGTWNTCQDDAACKW
jgi:hypothetical protein